MDRPSFGKEEIVQENRTGTTDGLRKRARGGWLRTPSAASSRQRANNAVRATFRNPYIGNCAMTRGVSSVAAGNDQNHQITEGPRVQSQARALLTEKVDMFSKRRPSMSPVGGWLKKTLGQWVCRLRSAQVSS